MDYCLGRDAVSMMKEKLELDLISHSSVSFSSASAYGSVLVAAGSSVSRESSL